MDSVDARRARRRDDGDDSAERVKSGRQMSVAIESVESQDYFLPLPMLGDKKGHKAVSDIADSSDSFVTIDSQDM